MSLFGAFLTHTNIPTHTLPDISIEIMIGNEPFTPQDYLVCGKYYKENKSSTEPHSRLDLKKKKSLSQWIANVALGFLFVCLIYEGLPSIFILDLLLNRILL